MPNYKSSAFWVASKQELINNFQFDSTDEDGLFMFVGIGSNQALYIWRKAGVVDNPKDIPANLGCWKFFSSTETVNLADIASWSNIQTLLYNGISQNRFDLQAYSVISWDDIAIKMLPIINANEVAEANYLANVADRELLTHFAYIYNLRFNKSYENEKIIPTEDTSITNWDFIKTNLDFKTLRNRNSYVVKEDSNYSSLDNTTLALQVQQIKLSEVKNTIRKYNIEGLCDYSVIGLSLYKSVQKNKQVDYISENSLLTDWGYICHLR